MSNFPAPPRQPDDLMLGVHIVDVDSEDGRRAFRAFRHELDPEKLYIERWGDDATLPILVTDPHVVAFISMMAAQLERAEHQLRAPEKVEADLRGANVDAFGTSTVPKTVGARVDEDASPPDEAPVSKTRQRWSDKLRNGNPGNEFCIADLRVDVTAGAKGLLVFIEKHGKGGTRISEGVDVPGDLLVELIVALLEHIDVLETPFVDLDATTAAISALQDRIFKTAVEKGWWPEMPLEMTPAARSQFVLSKLALINSEVAEALELARDDNYATFHDEAKASKPEGFGVEIADVIIRCMDLCSALGIPLGALIVEKVTFNETRQHRHGGRLA